MADSNGNACHKNSLKIPKRSKAVNRRTDNTNEKGQNDKHRSTNITQKTKNRTIPTPLKNGGEHRCPGRFSNSFSTCGSRRIILVTNTVISHERGKDRMLITTSGIFRSVVICDSDIPHTVTVNQLIVVTVKLQLNC